MNIGKQNKGIEADLQERLRFESLLTDLAATLVNLSASEVDDQIQFVLKSIVEFLDVDRGTVFQVDEDSSQVVSTHSWARKGFEGPSVGNVVNDLFPWGIKKIQQGEAIVMSRVEDLPPEATRERTVILEEGQKSIIALPFRISGSVIGAVTFDSIRFERTWTHEILNRLRLISDIIGNSLKRKKAEESLHHALEEVSALKQQLETERDFLREEIRLEHNFDDIIGQSAAIKNVFMQVERVSPTDASVLILGETGTGKELIARAIHNRSKRSEQPLIKINCAALPANLIESELFGHEKGAFTNAHNRHIGKFELANNATIFLDEIGELALEAQAKLLRVLQDGEFERLGGNTMIHSNTRMIAATNRNLQEEVRQGRFREDLWYRISVFPITLPPLRDRPEDIPLLVNWCVKKASRKLGKEIVRIPENIIKVFQNDPWPGNVRELENAVERAVIYSTGKVLQLPSPHNSLSGEHPTRLSPRNLDEMEKSTILQVLEETKWRISGRNGAAAILGLNPSTLRGRMRKHGIKRP